MAKDLGICALIDTYGAVLTEKQRAVLLMYYFEDLSLSEIAELEGISRQGVRDAIKRGEAVIIELEQQLHFANRFSELSAYARRIRKSAKDILAYSDALGYAQQVRLAAQDIVLAADGLDGFVHSEES